MKYVKQSVQSSMEGKERIRILPFPPNMQVHFPQMEHALKHVLLDQIPAQQIQEAFSDT